MPMQLSEQNDHNGSAKEPQPPVDGSCYINTEKIVIPAPGILQVMKQEAAVRLERYRRNEIHLLKIIMHWSHRDLSSFF